jgi:hypothetical protein
MIDHIDYLTKEKNVKIYLNVVDDNLRKMLVDATCPDVEIDFQYFEEASNIGVGAAPSPYIRLIRMNRHTFIETEISERKFKLVLGCIQFFKEGKIFENYYEISMNLYLDGEILRTFNAKLRRV